MSQIGPLRRTGGEQGSGEDNQRRLAKKTEQKQRNNNTTAQQQHATETTIQTTSSRFTNFILNLFFRAQSSETVKQKCFQCNALRTATLFLYRIKSVRVNKSGAALLAHVTKFNETSSRKAMAMLGRG